MTDYRTKEEIDLELLSVIRHWAEMKTPLRTTKLRKYARLNPLYAKKCLDGLVKEGLIERKLKRWYVTNKGEAKLDAAE